MIALHRVDKDECSPAILPSHCLNRPRYLFQFPTLCAYLVNDQEDQYSIYIYIHQTTKLSKQGGEPFRPKDEGYSEMERHFDPEPCKSLW